MKKCFVFLGGLILLGGLMIWQQAFLLTQYAQFFTVSNATKEADAIVVLSGGIMTRLPYAVELYQNGYAPLLFFTEQRSHTVSPKLRSLKRPQAESIANIIRLLEVDVNWALLPSTKGGATSTFDEAYDLLQYSRQNPLKRIILVTDAFHTRRSLYAFEKVLEESGIEVQAMGAPNLIFNESNWWQSDLGISMYVLEGVKYLVYRFTKQNVTFVKNY